jgi:hypothetical protein
VVFRTAKPFPLPHFLSLPHLPPKYILLLVPCLPFPHSMTPAHPIRCPCFLLLDTQKRPSLSVLAEERHGCLPLSWRSILLSLPAPRLSHTPYWPVTPLTLLQPTQIGQACRILRTIIPMFTQTVLFELTCTPMNSCNLLPSFL